jgi:hypothetical protein
MSYLSDWKDWEEGAQRALAAQADVEHKLMELVKEPRDDDREVWKGRCKCGRIWYGPRPRILHTSSLHIGAPR